MAASNNPEQLPGAEDVAGYGMHYNENDFWKKVTSLPRSTIGTVLEKALLCRELLLDRNTPIYIRSILLGSLGYLISPWDLAFDYIPGVGFVDDLALLGMILANLDHLVTDAIRQRVQERLPADLRRLPQPTATDG